MKKLLLIVLLIVGCDKDPVNSMYSISDLGGIWMGSITSTGSSLPDCINWDVSGSGSLESQTKMNLECSGTFCGSGGGQEASFSGTLTKQS